jgi:cytoskeletal protein CcmA (bactofilin family)
MFDKKKTEQTPVSGSATLVSAGTTFQGDINSDNDLRIDGTIKGNIRSSARIVIGPTGVVEGNIHGTHADITGKVKGDIEVKDLLQLRENSNVAGNIIATKLQVDPTAVFNGKCQMGPQAASIVKMDQPDAQPTVTAKAK